MQTTKKHLLLTLLILTILLTVLFIIGELSNQQLTIYLPPVQTQTAAVADFDSALVAHYTFDDGTVTDSSGNGNGGTLVNGPVLTAGKVGSGALSFNGTSSYVNLSQPTSLDMSSTNAFTISTWVYPTNNAVSWKEVFTRGSGGSTSADAEVYQLGQYAFSQRWRAVVSDGTTQIVALSNDGDLTLNAWQHVVVTWNGTNKTLTIYKDKVSIASATDAAFTSIWDGGATSVNRNTGIGFSARDVSDFFGGTVDDLRIYNRALTPAEISQLYDLGSVGTPAGGGTTPTGTGTSGTVTPQTCTSFTYSAWSLCVNGSQTQTVTSSLPAGCTGGSPVTTQTCTVTPTPTPTPVQTVGTCSNISQYGITWTFDKAYSCGQFVNGDWWVVGPVVINSVSPGWDGTKNGSMLDPSANGIQGYDNRVRNYYQFNDSARAKFPLTISSGNHSLVSVIGLVQNKIGGAYEALDTAAVLTITNSAIPSGTFRPQYASGAKTFYNTSQVNYGSLPSLPVPSGISLPNYSSYMTRVWLNHGPQVWGTTIHPVTSLPAYPRDSATQVSEMSLLALLNISDKTSVVNRFIQVGIDQYGVALQNGDAFSANGGYGSGWKWPILFAGMLLNDTNLKNPPSTTVSHFSGLSVAKFGEDGQTYNYNDSSLRNVDDLGFQLKGTRSWFNNSTALWRITDDSYYKAEYQHKHPRYWTSDGRGLSVTSPTGITIQDPSSGANSDIRGDGYRECCTSYTWVGEALAARLLNAQSIWNHPAFFDYVDSWMLPKDPSYWNIILTSTHETVANIGAGTYQGSSLSPFIDAMWRTYRNNSVTLTPSNGLCSATLNSCSSGAFSDVVDTSTSYLWQCVGSNGGSTASCSLPITTTPIIGDFDHNGVVNSLDLSMLTDPLVWNHSSTTFDLNHDNIVNSLDYVIMVQNWTM